MSKVNRNEPKRSVALESRYSLVEFERDFPDDMTCLDYLVRTLYPNGVFCKNCQKVTKHYRDKNRPSYTCEFCGHHEHPMAGTIFQDSATSLKLWFYAIYLMTSTRCGISAKQLERELGVTYKTAWRMFNKIRSLMKPAPFPIGGTVEVDETYIGPRHGREGHPSPEGPAVPLFGMAQRTHAAQYGRIGARVVPDGSRRVLPMHIKSKVLPSAIVHTDEFKFKVPWPSLGIAFTIPRRCT
jgi:transposase